MFLLGAIAYYGIDKALVKLESLFVAYAPYSIIVDISFIGLGIAGAFIITWDRFKKRKLDPKFSHLTIHYSRKTDNPNTKSPARPRYVTNNRTNQAYWVSTLTDSNRHAINWHTHHNKEALLDYFNKNGIHVNERDATFEELGLTEDR